MLSHSSALHFVSGKLSTVCCEYRVVSILLYYVFQQTYVPYLCFLIEVRVSMRVSALSNADLMLVYF
jgi:hypothetical protein